MDDGVLTAHMLVLLSAVLIAGSFIAAEKLTGIINPLSLTLLRFVGAALILCPFVVFNPVFRRQVFSTLPRASIISLFYAIFFICLFESLKTTTSLNTGTLYTLVPFTTAFLCLFVFKEKISSKNLAAYVLGLVGTLWVIFKGDIHLFLALSLNQGDYIFMAGAISMCCYTISMKVFYRNDNMVVLVFCILASGSLWLALSLLYTGLPLEWHLLKGASVFYMGYLVVCATLATVYLFQKSTIVLGPSKVMAYIYLNPVLVALLLTVINGTPIPFILVPGILCTTIAMVILQKSTRI